MRKIILACALSFLCGPASAQCRQSGNGTWDCSPNGGLIVGSGSNVVSIGSTTPPPQDLIINSKNEGLVLIRGIQGCPSVAEHLRDSSDVTKSECRK